VCGKDCGEHRASEHLDGQTCCPAHAIRGFVQPWALLLLLQGPTHGYELLERLAEDDDIPGPDPGLLYRTLRKLERRGLVRSTWETERAGPARRLYQVTPQGQEFVHAWAERVRTIRRRLDRFMVEYERQFGVREGEENHA